MRGASTHSKGASTHSKGYEYSVASTRRQRLRAAGRDRPLGEGGLPLGIMEARLRDGRERVALFRHKLAEDLPGRVWYRMRGAPPAALGLPLGYGPSLCDPCEARARRWYRRARKGYC